MEESKDNMSTEEVKKVDNLSAVKKPKKRSLVERELETSLTARITSPAAIGEGLSKSRYGRARRLKTEAELIESQKVMLAAVKSPENENTPVKLQSPVYRMHASNSPHKADTPKKALDTSLDNQIDNIYHENISLSRFSDDANSQSPAKKFPKVYVRKDLIQKREAEEPIMLIKNLFSPSSKSATKSSNSPLSTSLELSSEKYKSNQNGLDNTSVVKTLDFDGNKKKRKDRDIKPVISKNELFDLEAKCPYQVGDLAWARMGTFPFWPCIITREPYSEMFVKKKLFGRVEHDIIHVTFFGDNGRRSWIVDNMLRKYVGRLEFESTRDKFTPEDKKKDPRLYAAFFISEKKQALWNTSVEEAETLMREPKRLRVDIFNDMLWNFRASKKNQKSGKITITKTDSSGVLLSESLYDSLFSEDDVKIEDAERSKNRSRNKSFDVSEVVTACLDNMAAKTGITKIQRQSHMDRWLQKAKSKTPEKTQAKLPVPIKVEIPEKPLAMSTNKPVKLVRKVSTRRNNDSAASVSSQKPYRFRKSNKSQSDNELKDDSLNITTENEISNSDLGALKNVEPLADKAEDVKQDTSAAISIEDAASDIVIQPKVEPIVDSTLINPVEEDLKSNSTINIIDSNAVIQLTDETADLTSINSANSENSGAIITQKQEVLEISTDILNNSEKSVKLVRKVIPKENNDSTASVPSQKPYRFRKSNKSRSKNDSISDSSMIDDSINITTANKNTNTDLGAVKNGDCQADKVEDDIQSTLAIISTNDATFDTVTLLKDEPKQEPIVDSIFNSIGDGSNMFDIEDCKQNLNLNILDPNDVIQLIKEKPDLSSVNSANSEHSSAVIKPQEEPLNESTNKLNNCEKSASANTKQDDNDVMEVDENIINAEDKNAENSSLQANYEPSESYNVNKDTAMEVDDDANIESQMKSEKSNLQPETVSNKSVEDIEVQLTDNNFNIRSDTGLKEARNVVTIEASVTETKNDDTLNNQAEMGQQESNDKIKSSQNLESKVDNIGFLDVQSAKYMTVIRQVTLEPKNTSTPEKSKTCHEIESNSNHSSDTLENQAINLKETICFQNANEIPFLNDDSSETHLEKVHKENEMSIDECNIEEDMTINDANNVLNESTNSVSILDATNDNDDPKSEDSPKCPENIAEGMSNDNIKDILNESDISETILQPTNGTEVPESDDTQRVSENTGMEEISNIDAAVVLSEGGKSASVFLPADDTEIADIQKYVENTEEELKNYDTKNFLNETGKTASILIPNKEDDTFQTTLEDAVSKSIEIESTLDSRHKSFNIDRNDSEIVASTNEFEGSIKPNLNAENHDSSTRQYVESPTFTQLLESEEFFRDVNEPYNREQNHESKVNQNNIQNRELIDKVEFTPRIIEKNEINEVDTVKLQNEKTTNENVDELYKDEDTSDDEPSPEYESLDEDITEDFRKHMMSIESNVTDKKDEEQIVKICNEIAEKAKLSPTKYTLDAKVSIPEDILDASIAKQEKQKKQSKAIDELKCNHTKTQKSYEKEEILSLSNAKQEKQKKQTIAIDELKSGDTKPQKSYEKVEILEANIAKQEKQKELTKAFVKLKSSKNKTQKSYEKIEVCKIHSIESDITINGDISAKEVNETKRIYKTRLSVNSVTKERASPGIKQEYSDIEQFRKSEPRVVLIPLDRYDADSMRLTFNKAKSVKDDKSTTVSIKSRLSLKKNSPKSTCTENKTTENNDDVKIVINKNSESLKSDLVVKENELATMNKPPNKIYIENSAIETKIPEPIKLNGYLNNVDRKHADTPEIDDTDFDIDAVSLNSEDSEISLPNSIEITPRRNLRSRPERTLESALKNPEFLKYLELRQDYLMDENPHLNDDEVVNYVYKTWQYEEDSKCGFKNEDDLHHKNVINGLKQETPSRKKSKKSQPKNNIENYFREKYEKCRNNVDLNLENGFAASDPNEALINQTYSKSSGESVEVGNSKNQADEVKLAALPILPDLVLNETKDLAPKNRTNSQQVELTSESSEEVCFVKDKSVKSGESSTPKRSLRYQAITPKTLEKINSVEDKSTTDRKLKEELELDTESIDSEDSEIPLRQLRSKAIKQNKVNGHNKEPTLEKIVLTSKDTGLALETALKDEAEETASTASDNEPLLKQKKKTIEKKSVENPEFIKYMELKQDALMDENPQLKQDEIIGYLYKTWLYEENSKSEFKKNDEVEEANLVKGINNNDAKTPKKVRRKAKIVKQVENLIETPREKPRRKTVHPFYYENFSDIEDELEVFEIFKTKKAPITIVSKTETEKDKLKSPSTKTVLGEIDNNVKDETVKQETEPVDDEIDYVDEIELYFTELTKPKPSVFKGLIREKVCEICECTDSLVKCKGCNAMFHPDCVKRETEAMEKEPNLPSKSKKKKKKPGRRTKGPEDSESQSDEKSQDLSADNIEDVMPQRFTFDAEAFETQLSAKMKELLENSETNYDDYTSDDGINWNDTAPGKCEIVDVKLKRRSAPIDYSDFKCHNCQKHDTPVCFVCKSAISKTDVKMRQKCHVAHCHKYYHLECLDHWPQTQFNSGEPSRNNKNADDLIEALTCPRHVCHTCVSDDPRGCRTRFSGDKLAKCVRCPATYHSFNKCLPAGSQILTASHIICPRHIDNIPGKVPCHVNTGWCFICAQGGSLICCEYCPTSFHAECLNIKPPEGNYMCEDCETGRLPLYGEMVWVKLGHYRWWPGIVLHPSEIPENIMTVRHSLGEFVVRFFGQYDHYWVNRGRVFPYQEGDSGRISSQKSKINEAFITAIEHAQRAFTILKNAEPNEEESAEIAASLLPPHYVKLKVNKPRGSLCARRPEDPALSLTQCECAAGDPHPCGPYSHCLNRMLLTECGPTCQAGDRCNNRAFEKRLYPKLVPYRTPHRGWGLKTLEEIKAGQFVIEYVGELIDEEEFKRRMRRKHEIRDENFYFLTLDKERMIDAGPKGNLARFMNHCCEPNCETQKWTVLGDVRVGLFAIDDIPANSEVTFNYNLECAGIDKKRCMCGAKRCSGYIGAKPKQDESQSKKGKDKVPTKRTYKKKKVEESPSTSGNKPKKPVGRPPKPKELTEIEKDLLIIKNATSVAPSDDASTTQSTNDKTPKSLKRKRVSNSTDEVSICNGQKPSVKKQKCEEKPSEVGD